jgi:cell division protein FtsW
LLLFTLLKGTNINNANRWLTIPIINQNFQTSDLAKISLIIYVARYLAQQKDQLSKFNTGVLPVLLRVGLMCTLILPANFSTAALLFAVCFIMLFVGRIPFLHLFGVVALGVIAIGMMIGIATVQPDLLPRATTWKNRILNHQSGSEKENFQVIQAKYAIASGGLLPNGPGKGNSRNYLPHPYSDMIYAFIIEEYGALLGGIGLVLAYLTLFSRSLRIAIRSSSHFGAYLVVGLSVSLMLQALINMMVAVNIIPVTGQPLPLLSMGGTSTVFTCIAFGMILCVGRATQNETKGGNHAVA